MLKRLLVLCFIFPSITGYSQEIKPPLGLEFGMSKANFIKTINQHLKDNGKAQKPLDIDPTVTYAEMALGTVHAKNLSGRFYKDQLYSVRVTLDRKYQDELVFIYSEKYGQSTNPSSFVRETPSNVIRIYKSDFDKPDNKLVYLTFTNKTLDKKWLESNPNSRKQKEKDF